jgi:hypothetical protein
LPIKAKPTLNETSEPPRKKTAHEKMRENAQRADLMDRLKSQGFGNSQMFNAEDMKNMSPEEMAAKIDRYENEPGEGKKDLMKKAKALEAERDDAKQRSPWIGYASTAYQMAIVVLSASILAVSMYLFWASFAVAGFGLLLSLQGVFLWF